MNIKYYIIKILIEMMLQVCNIAFQFFMWYFPLVKETSISDGINGET